MADTDTKSALCGNLARFLDSPDLSDFAITSNGARWNVHRLVLSLHSDVLNKACDNEFKEGRDRVLDLSVHAKEHVEALVQYLYKLDYNIETKAKVKAEEDSSEGVDGSANESKVNEGRQLCLHVSICVLADKFNIDGLQKLSVQKFKVNH